MFLILSNFVAFAQPRLMAILGSETELLQIFPAEEKLTYRTDQFVQSTNQRRQFEGTIETTRQQNTLRQLASNPNSSTTLSLEGTVRFGSVENRFRDPEAVKRLGYDRIVTRLSGRELRSQKFENGREVGNHRWQMENNAVDGDMIAILLRTLSSRPSIQTFLAQVFTKWDGGNYEMQFTREKLKTVIERERQTPFPAAMRRFLNQFPDAVSWSMGLTGPAALFFPHKFYFVFEESAPHRLLGTWGGPPERSSFTWLVSP